MPINCACDDASGYRTLGQLRTALIERLGFADPLGAPATRTLSALRQDMLYLLGYGTQVASPPPGVVGTLNTFLNEAQQALFRRLELDRGSAAPPARMTADTDPTTLDYQPVLTLAMAMACAHYAKPEAKAYFEQHEKYVADVAARRPPGLADMLTAMLQEAQQTLLRRFPALRTARWFSWALTAGERFYDLPANYEQTAPPTCTKQLDPSRIIEAWIERDTTRTRLQYGVPSALVAQNITGWPTHYEVRQCLELWPAPEATEGFLRIKGHFKASAFASDNDVATVDDHAVFLLALANAKAHYKQPDARDVMGQFEVYLQNLVSGTHGTARYVPGRHAEPVYVEPRPTVPFP